MTNITNIIYNFNLTPSQQPNKNQLEQSILPNQPQTTTNNGRQLPAGQSLPAGQNNLIGQVPAHSKSSSNNMGQASNNPRRITTT